MDQKETIDANLLIKTMTFKVFHLFYLFLLIYYLLPT